MKLTSDLFITTTSLAIRMIAIFVVVLLSSSSYISAQQPVRPDMTIDAATRTAVIEGLIKELNASYVFPEKAKKMEDDLRGRLRANEYDQSTSARAFAAKLTADLQSVSHDKHLRVGFSNASLPVRKDNEELTASEKAEQARYTRFINYGFEQVERMGGNIGYIRFNGFFDPEKGADTVTAAMNFVANTDSLIFDLRDNGGGDPAMVGLICSYLFGDKPVHLNDLYWRVDSKTEEFWTTPTVAGKKFLDKDVYVLVSSRTFSGAEEFSYNLKNLKRATIVGETTGGGAHPGNVVRITDHFRAFISQGRAINPITKTNWEGTGVEPDIKVPPDQALKTTYILALNKVLANAKDDSLRAEIKDLIDKTQKDLDKMRTAR